MHPTLARARPGRRLGEQAYLGTSLALAALWMLIGALACAATYQMSLHPENPADAAPFPGTLWYPVLVLAGILVLVLMPIPVIVLITGLIYLRRVTLSRWWKGTWIGAAMIDVAVDALFLRGIAISPTLRHPSWGPTMLAAAFVAAGAVMIGTLAVAVPAGRRRSTTPPN